MKTVSKHFGLGKSQAELDFLDIVLNKDNRLYLDPFALSIQPDRWSVDAHLTLVSYFDSVVIAIREGRHDDAKELLTNLNEPNETRLGQSRGKPKGAGIGDDQADDIYEALKKSGAVKTGVLSSLQECELFIPGIGWDKISDLTTNVIRKHLADYTTAQCDLHDIPFENVALSPYYDTDLQNWVSAEFEVPVVNGLPLLLVPRSIVRRAPAYDHGKFYTHFVLTTLQVQHLNAGSSLVRSIKNKKKRTVTKRVYKKDLREHYPSSKDALADFIRKNPEVLKAYRERLVSSADSVRDESKEFEIVDEVVVAESLRDALKSIPKGSADATRYHRLMIGILEFLFFPNLGHPKKEKEIHEGRKRIDILIENCATSGIFHRLHSIRKIPCAFVPVECKNYTTDVANPELDQISGRFSPNLGKVGFVCCRAFEDRSLFVKRCVDTFKDDRGLICPLDDKTIDLLLSEIANGHREKVDHRLTELVDEVWVS